MCGRYVIVSPPEALRRLFGYGEQPNMPPRYNIAPTQPVPVVTGGADARHLRLMRWGFLPAWLKDPRGFPLLINARAETVAEKAAFRNAIRRRRCLLPADGYYEWQVQGARKQPFYIHPRGGQPMAFAGVAETWCGPNGEEVDTVAIGTTQAPPDLANLHHRVPVVIEPDDFAPWPDAGAELDVGQHAVERDCLANALTTQVRDRAIPRDSVQPGNEAAIVRKRVHLLMNGEEHVLSQVVRLIGIADEAEKVKSDTSVIAQHEQIERFSGAGPCRCDQVSFDADIVC